jgi:hypothetical protein
MQVGPTSDSSAHMYSIHFLNILYHYMCATRAHQWRKRSGTTYRGQFCWWRAPINPRFASAINSRSRWGWKNPLNLCASCNSYKARKSSNPVARSLQPPSYPFFAKKEVSCPNCWMESPFWVKIVFSYTLFISSPSLKTSKNHDKKKTTIAWPKVVKWHICHSGL